MSLRLPSQNKFRPTARPGVKRPAAVAPGRSSTTPITASAAGVSGQHVASRAASQVQKSGSTLPGSLNVAGPTPSPQPISSQALPSPSQPSSFQLPPSLDAPSSKPSQSPTPKPISSSQVQAIRRQSQSPTKAPSQLPPASTLTSLPPPFLPVALTTSANQTSSSNATHPAVISPSPLPTSNAIRESTPRPAGLSLLEAARVQAAAGPSKPSPGAIRRGSSRAPSVTPQPGRAPSVTPQPQRAPSITPRLRTPSVTPQPSSSFGFPPSLATSSQHMSQPGLPPTLGTTSAPSRERSVTPAQPTDPATLAALVVASIQPVSRPPAYAIEKPVRRVRRRVAVKKLTPEVDELEEDGEQGSGRPKKIARRGGAKKTLREPSEVPSEERQTSDEAESIATTANGTRGPKKAPRSMQTIRIQSVAVSQISLHDVQPDEMVGDKVDEASVTMGDLATILAAQGKVSQRAIKIDEYRRHEEMRKREESQIRARHTWMRNQIKRRKVRATKNAERLKRRIELEQLGMDPSEVTADEDDSEEEFEPEPERLTPESTPDPDAPPALAALQGSDAEEDENGDEHIHDDGDGWEQEHVNETEGALFLPGGGEEDVNQDDLDFLASIENNDGNGQPADDEDPDIAGLRAAGFAIAGADGQGQGAMGGEGENDEDEDMEFEWDNDEMDLGAYRDQMEERRRRLAEERDDQPVEELDDETKFINNGSFAKNTRPQRWTPMETELFYQVLEETGENYTLMKAYFPGRNIRQLKLKGLREDRANPAGMTAAILKRKPIDKEYLTKSAGYDPHRAWDREQALFEEARLDAERLRGVDDSALMDGEGHALGPDEDGDVRLEEAVMDEEDEEDEEEEKGSDYDGEKEDDDGDDGDGI